MLSGAFRDQISVNLRFEFILIPGVTNSILNRVFGSRGHKQFGASRTRGYEQDDTPRGNIQRIQTYRQSDVISKRSR